MNKIYAVLKSPKMYARLTGIVLFLVGLLGFAFRSSSSLPDLYLVGALALGFWGIIVSFSLER
jgi:hypothetical protein